MPNFNKNIDKIIMNLIENFLRKLEILKHLIPTHSKKLFNQKEEEAITRFPYDFFNKLRFATR
jgi:hypothetical protein